MTAWNALLGKQDDDDEDLTVGNQLTDNSPAIDATSAPPTASTVATAASAKPFRATYKAPPPLDLSALKSAQSDDAEEARKARFYAGLATAASGKVVEPQSTGTARADAIIKQLALQRQSQQDVRQAQVDSQNSDLVAARSQYYLNKGNPVAKPESELDAARVQALKDKHDKISADADALKTAQDAFGKEFGIDASGLSMAAMDQIRKVRDGDENRKHRTKAELLAEQGMEIKKKKLGIVETKLGREVSQSTTTGFEPDPDTGSRVMQPAEAKDLGNEQAASAKIGQKVDQMLDIIHQHGGVPWNSSTADSARFNLIYNEVKPLLTISSGMGNFTQGHDHVVTDAMSDPRSFANLLNSGRFEAVLNELKQSSKDAVTESARSKGQRQVAPGSAPSPTPGRTPVPPGMNLDTPAPKASKKVQLVGPNGERHEWDAGDPEIQSAVAHGWKRG
jgi:hypothetical protein